MQAYGINYEVNGKKFDAVVDAKDKKSARRKLARKHKVGERAVKMTRVYVVGYF